MRTPTTPITLAITLAIPLALSNAPADAQWRCDCTTITATCSASVTLEPNFIEVNTDSAQCARVDYFVDGLPFVSVVVDGQAREDWITRAEDPQIIVQGCQVCRDNAGSTPATSTAPGPARATPPTASNATAASAPGADAQLLPLIAPQPTYPEPAQARGIEGYVTVEFVVNPFGDVASPRVVAAEPAQVFNLAALSAVSRWRYPSDPSRAPVTLQETVRFDLDEFIWRTPVGNVAPSTAISQSPSGPMNRCVRENLSYNYGEMVEVSLIDACSSPLLVFACAVGTGAVAERWVCQDSESQNAVLIGPGDARIGSAVTVQTDAIQRQYRYADSFFVARAPNTEYWWIACAVNDRSCRDEARRWSAGLDRQTANIDPRQRTRIELGRSY